MNNKNLLLFWTIVNGIAALLVCYVLMFGEDLTTTGKAAMALFFVSVFGRSMVGRKYNRQ